jgi:hypothetical protein
MDTWKASCSTQNPSRHNPPVISDTLELVGSAEYWLITKILQSTQKKKKGEFYKVKSDQHQNKRENK